MSNLVGSQKSPVDEYVQTLVGPSHKSLTSKMVSSSLASTCSNSEHTTLVHIGVCLKRMASSMVTKHDLQQLLNTLHEVIKFEVAVLKTDASAQETRIQTLEHCAEATAAKAQAADMAIQRQSTYAPSYEEKHENLNNYRCCCNIGIQAERGGCGRPFISLVPHITSALELQGY
ncbi:Hypothetical predicted protein [Pelobates cultripes]|uniref:Uncharacterized protein n=1 Tax=Pelobates cultripes TaxID=61616 RepID=A0AAD1T619_PELCU|nr:Hypothetical predicted protein [Pelobates cultripes]